MEKRTPHCPLERVWALIAAGRIRTTSTALQGAQASGVDYPCMLEVIMSFKRTDFHKSMTSHVERRIWQESVYLKLSVIDDVLIVSFKEL